ncbi:MAG: lipocalin family protein [Sulfurospirillum sp.]
MKKWLLLCLSLFWGYANELPTVSSVDLERYLGRWYEIARFDHRFERGCSEVEAFYTLRDDGMIGVKNSCFLADENRTKEAHGRAYIVDEKSNAKLKVTFFWPFYGNYWIIDLAEDYRYAVISEPSQEYFWILSRTPQMTQDDINHIVHYASTLGFDTSKLIWR